MIAEDGTTIADVVINMVDVAVHYWMFFSSVSLCVYTYTVMDSSWQRNFLSTTNNKTKALVDVGVLKNVDHEKIKRKENEQK